MFGFINAYPPLADALRPFLSQPSNLHIILTHFYRLLIDIYISKNGAVGLPPGLVDQLALPPGALTGVSRHEWSAISWNTCLAKDPRISRDVNTTLKSMDVEGLWQYVSRKYGIEFGRPDKVTKFFCLATNKYEEALKGKLFILSCALSLLDPTNEQWETLRRLVSLQPDYDHHDNNYFRQLAESVPGGFYELNKALARYLVYPYTMDEAPQYHTMGCFPGQLGYDNVFRQAHDAPSFRERIKYPKGAPLARGPREEAITQILRYFIRMCVNVSDLWIHLKEPALWQYRIAQSHTAMELSEELQDPFSPIPGRVKQHLAEINFSGAWSIIWKSARDLQHRENVHSSEFGWRLFQKVIQTATIPSQDPRGIVKRVVERQYGIIFEETTYFRPKGFTTVTFDLGRYRKSMVEEIAAHEMEAAEQTFFGSW